MITGEDAGAGRSPATPYYAFVDGLRALAVVAVIAYHFDERILPGGFVGVDVFFVLSGFVVSASVAGLEPRRAGRFVLRFVARRMRRILPALLVCLGVTAVLAAMFIPTVYLTRDVHSFARAAVLGLSNFRLAAGTDDYFSPVTDFNPYVHTWSLGVEEQFYVVFPVLAIALFAGPRIRRVATVLVAAAALASVGVAWHWHTGGRQRWAFALLPGRWWQLASGVLVWLAVARVRAWVLLARRPVIASTVAALGTAAIVVATVLARPGHTPWPDSLLPVLGTAMALAALAVGAASPVATLLASTPLRVVGLRSYSLYLWHWPLLVLARWTIGLDRWAARLTVLGLVVLAAEVSYRWVERPFRHNRWIATRAPWQVIAAGLACVGLVLVGVTTAGEREATLSRTAFVRDRAAWRGGFVNPRPPAAGCTLDTQVISEGGWQVGSVTRRGCEQALADQRRVLVAGDSHAGAWLGLYRQVVMDTGVELRYYTAAACAVASSLEDRATVERRCGRFHAAWLAESASFLRRGDVLFLPGLRVPRLNTAGFRLPGVKERADQAAMERSVRARVDAAIVVLRPLAQRGVSIIIEAPKPVFEVSALFCGAWYQRGRGDCGHGSRRARAGFEASRRPVLGALRGLVAALPGSRLWDPTDLFCDASTCTLFRDGKPLLYDADHPSGTLGTLAAPTLERLLAELAEP